MEDEPLAVPYGAPDDVPTVCVEPGLALLVVAFANRARLNVFAKSAAKSKRGLHPLHAVL